ncbi:MAG: metal-dependent transcriptional regulator [Firmicutes bacterium]|nr:metal-dependent transcriptional regulator [Bacillota bacterium]MBQ3122935.1 metal-dependent transcriptional regulator [Bacillota bacterium]MBQ9972807.1 metal-dependent transcriptional regulator [Bacillota bacterium]
MAIYESGEDYLENILILKKEKGTVRSVDVASKMGYSKPSVSRAMHILKDAGLIDMDESGHITLTESGNELAERVYERHLVITEYLTRILGVSEENAKEDACKIEHDLSDETYSKIKELVKGKL